MKNQARLPIFTIQVLFWVNSGTNKAIEIAKMKQKKYAFAACCYQNYVYIFGGQDGKEGKVLSYAEKYSINEDKWIELP